MSSMRRRTGRVILTEELIVEGGRFQVPLRLHSVARRGGVREFSYSVQMDDPEISVSAKTPEECLALARVALTDKCALDWQSFLGVQVDRSDPDVRRSSNEMAHDSLEITVTPYQAAKSRKGDELLRTSPSETSSPFSRWELPDLVSIPDTPENRAKLHAIVGGLRQLGARLADLLGSKKILRTLADVRVLQLPAPKTEIALKRRNRK